jgi:hypothetical protein
VRPSVFDPLLTSGEPIEEHVEVHREREPDSSTIEFRVVDGTNRKLRLSLRRASVAAGDYRKSFVRLHPASTIQPRLREAPPQ